MGIKWSKTFKAILLLIVITLLLFALYSYHGG